MKCPSCKEANLVMSERSGVEIDYCPDCRGVWLDRGELDKILERSSQPEPSARREAEFSPRDKDYYSRDLEGKYRYKKKKSFLHELFD